jgi:Flp pilus assembly protein TadG
MVYRKGHVFRKVKTGGSSILDIIVGTAVVVLVILPVFSGIMEKYIISVKAQSIKDAVDMTNVSTYMSLDSDSLGKNVVDLDFEEVMDIYRRLLAANLNLNDDLTPKDISIAENTVTINSINLYYDAFPTECPNGTPVKRPAIHSYITVPVRPSIYRSMILRLTGREYIELKVHVDSDIPVDN